MACSLCKATLAKVTEHVDAQPYMSVLVDKVTIARRPVDVDTVLALVT